MRKLFTKDFWTSEGKTSETFKRRAEKIEKADAWIAYIGLALAAYCIYFACTHSMSAIAKLFEELK